MIKLQLGSLLYLSMAGIECKTLFYPYKANKRDFLFILLCLISEKLLCFLLNSSGAHQNHLERCQVSN